MLEEKLQKALEDYEKQRKEREKGSSREGRSCEETTRVRKKQ